MFNSKFFAVNLSWIALRTSMKKWFDMMGTNIIMLFFFFLASPWANTCGWYPISSATANTFSRVDSLTRPFSLNTLETVAILTPAALAISYIVLGKILIFDWMSDTLQQTCLVNSLEYHRQVNALKSPCCKNLTISYLLISVVNRTDFNFCSSTCN